MPAAREVSNTMFARTRPFPFLHLAAACLLAVAAGSGGSVPPVMAGAVAGGSPPPAERASELSPSAIRRIREGEQREDAPSSPLDRYPADLSPSVVRALRAGEDPPAIEAPASPAAPRESGREERPAARASRPADTPARSAWPQPVEQDPPPARREDPPERLAAIGRDMEPGEWRRVETTNLPSFRTRFCPLDDDDAGSTLALGWTDAFVYDPETQSFWALGMRNSSEKRLFFLNRDLEWNEVRVPVDECSFDRRPFNRLTLVDGYLYWPSSRAVDGDNRTRGVLWRAPIRPFLEGETDVEWEPYGPELGVRALRGVGHFAVEYYPELGGWVLYGRRPGAREDVRFSSQEGHTEEGAALGKNWYGQALFYKPGDDRWTFFDRAYAGQFRARLLYNPVRQEMLLAPGGEFGSQPEQDEPTNEWAIIRHSGGTGELVRYPGQGPVPWIEKLDRAVGKGLPHYHTAYDSLSYNPVTGGYLWWDRRKELMWSSTDGRHWEVYEDFADITSSRFPDGVEQFRGRRGLFGASGFIQMNALPGTDLILFVDPYRGLILHRLRVGAD